MLKFQIVWALLQYSSQQNFFKINFWIWASVWVWPEVLITWGSGDVFGFEIFAFHDDDVQSPHGGLVA